jgi:hypothetical protein
MLVFHVFHGYHGFHGASGGEGHVQFTSAEMILAGGAKRLPVKEAFGTVQSVLCEGTKSASDVYAVVVHGKHSSSKHLDHLSTMHSVIAATIKGWGELRKFSEKGGTSSKAKRSSMIEVVERNGIRFYWGCADPEQSKKAIVPAEGVYIFPSHWNHMTVRKLGLEPLPEQFQTSPLVIQVEDVESLIVTTGDAGETVATVEEQHLDRDSLAWRRAFVSNYECLTAEAVAEETGNTARNRSAIASRWATEKKIFSVRFENKTLYPKFQFKDGIPIPAVARVLELFADHFTGWDVAFFFTSPNSYLDGRRPVNLLKTDPERVVSLVNAFVHPADVF